MAHVFGPVPSRRLGRSLGVDPVPLKTCHWNCVYCQLGRTAPLRNERRDYVPPAAVVAEVEAALHADPSGVDWITFAGSGEPTLHLSLGWMIRAVQRATDVPVAVLTSGALLSDPQVRDDLMTADAVLPSLDAGSPDVYRAINRPWPDLTFARLVGGLLAFRATYQGRLWVEVMLVRGLNDGEEALRDIAAILAWIGPDLVHINAPVRPPAERWVEPPDVEAFERAAAILGGSLTLDAAPPLSTSPGPAGDAAARTLELITRHPMAETELVQILEQQAPDRVGETLEEIRASGRVRLVTRRGQRYWTPAAGRYA